ncbi:hypothetical protein OAY91_00470 [Candidatus Pelagibacter sp.]|nr:hypothetical protein [Candidatus Pelagibacter sp.]|tara:strand:+ start:273 stop:731 length:459 start_codon:yes stop_codon:yes gene_type:complete
MKKNFIRKIIIISFIFSLANISNISKVYAGWFDKKIKVTKCFRGNFNAGTNNAGGKWKSYKEMKKSDWSEPELSAEIDLEKEIVIIESIWSNKVSISKHSILSATDNFISTVPDPSWGTWVFDLKKEGLSGQNANRSAVRCHGDCIHKCSFN